MYSDYNVQSFLICFFYFSSVIFSISLTNFGGICYLIGNIIKYLYLDKVTIKFSWKILIYLINYSI